MRQLILISIFFLLSCSQPSKESVRESLDVVLKSDLADITLDIDSTLLVETPSYIVDSLNFFDKSKYSYKAVVNFYFLKSELFSIERKFRFNRELSKWERYYNEYKTIKK